MELLNANKELDEAGKPNIFIPTLLCVIVLNCSLYSDDVALKSHIGLWPSSRSQLHGENAVLSKTVRFLLSPLVFFEENKVGIVDYKTGRKNNTHKKQLEIYEKSLNNMGIITLEKVLIYTDKKIEVEIF